MAENEQSNRKNDLKKIIASFNSIASTKFVNKSTYGISGCIFTAESLNTKSKLAMVHMSYKNEANSANSVSLLVNINELGKSKDKQEAFVNNVIKTVADPEKLKANKANNSNFKPIYIVYNKVSENLNGKDIVKELKDRMKVSSESQVYTELTKRMLFILPDEKVVQIANGKMNVSELEGYVNDAIEAELFSHPVRHNAPTTKEREEKKVKEENKTEEEAKKEVQQEKEDFAKELQIEGGEEARQVAKEQLNGNMHERSATINKSLSNDDNLKKSFEALNSEMQGGGKPDRATLESFCKNFSESFMKAHGLPPVAIDVKQSCPDGTKTMGEFIDSGNSHKIEIYQENINNITEFAATLAHELSHAVDSSLSKIDGKDGIQGSFNFDITDNGASGPDAKKAGAFLKELNRMCYQADPCEQTARNGEQIGLDFVQNMTKDSPNREQINRQISDYKKEDARVQSRVNEVRNNLKNPSYISELQRKLDGLNVDSSTKSKIQERIDYLAERQREYANEDVRYKAAREAKQITDEVVKTTQGVVNVKQLGEE